MRRVVGSVVSGVLVAIGCGGPSDGGHGFMLER